MQLRPYQEAAIEAVYAHLSAKDDNPCVVIPTGGGKGVIVGKVCADVVQRWNGRILVLTHVKELVDQNATQASRFLTPLLVGVNSAGLRRRDLDHPVIVAGIQSVYQKAGELGRFDLVLIDEAHLIPPDGEGMYQTFLRDARVVNPRLRVIGLTATPFRLKDGPICAPGNILNQVCFEVGVKELIRDGFLSPLISKAGKAKADTASLHVRGGEFIPDEVEHLMDAEDLVRDACAEIAEHTQARKACLVFAAGIQHAEHVAATLTTATGSEVACIFGHTPDGERDRLVARFKAGQVKYLVNVGVLTTGFDAPQVDCVALLRPTLSAGLYYQMVGRGFRLAPGKDDCLVHDFGGNVLRHGPVDALKIKEPGEREGGAAPAKECPQCQAVIATGFAACPQCGFVFPPPEREKHEREASSAGVLSGQVTTVEHPVRQVFYGVHTKRGSPPEAPRSLRVGYEIGQDQVHKEWVCFEHTGFARGKAEAWWQARSALPVPTTAAEACRLACGGALAPTTHITVRTVAGEDFERIINHKLGARPREREPGEDTEEPAFQFTAVVASDDEVPF
ncbi:MAG: DEAD/DEAH box helicase family protein [Caulobacterales bacterium]|nr:DEAD/DEAH box helicase family protein [Caulobacterales bacterium]